MALTYHFPALNELTFSVGLMFYAQCTVKQYQDAKMCQTFIRLFPGFTVNGINNVNATSYERRFEMASSSVGWISSSFDISAAICGVIIGFYGSRRNKGRILTFAFVLSSIGSTCMFIPHFITPSYEWGQGKSHLCSDTGKY